MVEGAPNGAKFLLGFAFSDLRFGAFTAKGVLPIKLCCPCCRQSIQKDRMPRMGGVECIIETDRYIYIFEFKLDGTAAEALQQIEEKGYAKPYAADTRRLYRIEVSFSSETGTIEEFEIC